MTVHRVKTSTAAVVDDPSLLQLSDLVAEVDRSGDSGFVIAERQDSGPGETYLQAMRDSRGWHLELCDGGPDRQFEAEVADTALAYSALASWTHGARAWLRLPWRHVAQQSAFTHRLAV